MDIQSSGAASVVRVNEVSHGTNTHADVKVPEPFLHRVYTLTSPRCTSFHLVTVSAFLPPVCYEAAVVAKRRRPEPRPD